MKGILLKTQESKSKYGGKFYFAFFKVEGKSYRSCLYPTMRNFTRWSKFIGREGINLEGLTLKGNLIDADSFPKEVLECGI